MTEENSPPSVLYLDSADIETIHAALAAWSMKAGEPVPSFAYADKAGIDALVNAPRQSFSGHEAYPTLEEKAAIVFYMVNKRQMFANGNKRMSTLCLLVFLYINGKMLDVSDDELTTKALWLANTSSLEFPEIKGQLTAWIREHLQNVPTASGEGV